MNEFWSGAEVIHTYSRAQAIADGVLHEVDAATAREAGFTVPVALTQGAQALVRPTVEEEAGGQSYAGRLWDVLWMAACAVRGSIASHKISEAERLYPINFWMERSGWRNGLNETRLKIHSGPGDNFEHVITIMLPEED